MNVCKHGLTKVKTRKFLNIKNENFCIVDRIFKCLTNDIH